MVGVKDILLTLVLSGAVLVGPIRILMHSQCRRVPHEEELPRWAEGLFRWAGWTLERLGLAASVQAHRRWEWLGGPVMLPLANSVFVGLGFLLLSLWCNGSQQMWCDTVARSFSPGSGVFMEEFFPHSCLIVWGYMEFLLLKCICRAFGCSKTKAETSQRFSERIQKFRRTHGQYALPGLVILGLLTPWIILRGTGRLLRLLLERADVSSPWGQVAEEAVYAVGRSVGMGTVAVWLGAALFSNPSHLLRF